MNILPIINYNQILRFAQNDKKTIAKSNSFFV